MKHVFSISCAVFLSLLMLVTSCKKGDTGPAGADGPQGPQGPQGAQGPKGDTGVANVIYSAWLDVGYDTVWNATHDTIYRFEGGISAPKLTNDILTKGEIKVYINWNTAADPFIDALPITDLFYGIFIQASFVTGGILLTANDDYGTGIANNQKYLQYRYVLIPGGKAARSAIDWNNYAAVKEYLKLPD